MQHRRTWVSTARREGEAAMRLPDGTPAALALPTPQEMAAIDALASRTVPIGDLMDHAGRAVARAIMQHAAPCRVLVLCGPGNNGGDGYRAAAWLAHAGWPVCVAVLAPPRGAAAVAAAAAWAGPVVAFDPQEATRADLVVDAVFGAGLSRPMDERVEAVLRAARRVVAVDMPSGVDGATGAVLRFAPQAWLTVTFFRPKPGHVLEPGRGLCGALVCADIGIAGDVLDHVAVRTWRAAPALWSLPGQGADSHKYSRGVVTVCGGGAMPGAARLAAAAARASGAGLVRIAAFGGGDAYRLGAPGLVVDDAPLDVLMGDARRKVWVCGPGLTEDEVRRCLRPLINAGRTVLADAGAFSLAAGAPDVLREAAVITPHAGEFARVFGAPGADRLAAARRAAAQTGAVVVMKGSDTVIAAPDGRAAINAHATAALATAGSGDTLTGIIAALLAAGVAPWEAACAGVWMHGDAGIRAGAWIVAEDLDRHLGGARQAASGLMAPARVE